MSQSRARSTDANAKGRLARPRVAEAGVGHGSPLRVRQTETDLLFADVEWGSPAIVRVLQGQKQLRRADESLAARPGELLYLPAGTRVDVRNVPAQGAYEAEGVILSFELARYLPPRAEAREPQQVRKLRVAEHEELDAALTRCLEAFERGLPAAVQRSRLLELVAWLGEAGIDPFVAASDVRLRLKRMLGERPAHPWRLPDVARQLGMSDDTLQRHLRREGTGFQQLLLEIRMDHALMLLWTTERPLAVVAEQSGYDSPSRFAERFRDRFGVLPSELRRRR
ncbi:AraC family transcriptional regulator [Sorangium sp. So ce1151]|uniref:helix-turn-helix transcriptional regulator n=1 Tax=unclassified Sorangium TaxID=2621164 RepID=UPI003F5DF03E